MDTSNDTVKVAPSMWEGEKIEGEYDVVLNGTVVGQVRRNDSTPKGYWGRWRTKGMGHETRRQAVDHVVARAKARLAPKCDCMTEEQPDGTEVVAVHSANCTENLEAAR